jgi:hypothetical protein
VLRILLKQKRITAPIRLSLTLSQSPFLEVTVTVIRRDLPKHAEDCLRWATIITGALYWSLNHPPPIRREQFIVNLRKPYKFWISRANEKQAGVIRKETQSKIQPHEAERIAVCSNKPQWEKTIALTHSAILALHSKVPAKITVHLHNKEPKLPPENAVDALANFAQRLSLYFSMACQYAKYQPGGATQDKPLTYWVGGAAAVANQIIMAELANDRDPCPELKAILDEATQIEGVGRIQTQHDQRRFYTAFIVIRALKGTVGLKRLSALSPLMRNKLDGDKIASQIESFHYTYVQPYTQKLKNSPSFPILIEFLRPRLLGPPGLLAKEISLPKSAF